MSQRIYNNCNYIEKKWHTPVTCNACPAVTFWDAAFREVIEDLRYNKEA